MYSQGLEKYNHANKVLSKKTWHIYVCHNNKQFHIFKVFLFNQLHD